MTTSVRGAHAALATAATNEWLSQVLGSPAIVPVLSGALLATAVHGSRAIS
jgi:hypothetical protein